MGIRLTTALDRPPEEAAEDTSFARGLRVFLTIADRGEIRADELGTLLDTPLSTIYRYLRTLTEFGFVERQEARLPARPAAPPAGGAGRRHEELIRDADPSCGARRRGDRRDRVHLPPGRAGRGLPRTRSRRPHALRVDLEPGTATPARRRGGRPGPARVRPGRDPGCGPRRRRPMRRGAPARSRDRVAGGVRPGRGRDVLRGASTLAVPDPARRRDRGRDRAHRAGRARDPPMAGTSRPAPGRGAAAITRRAARVGPLAPTGTIAIWHRDFPRFDNRRGVADAAARWTRSPLSRRSRRPTRPPCRGRLRLDRRRRPARRGRVVPRGVPLGPAARRGRGPARRVRRAGPSRGRESRPGSSTTSRGRRRATGRASRSASGRSAPKRARPPAARSPRRGGLGARRDVRALHARVPARDRPAPGAAAVRAVRRGAAAQPRAAVAEPRSGRLRRGRHRCS